MVKTELPKYTLPFPTELKSVCNCDSCGFQDAENEAWSGFVQGFVNRACGNCGSRISHTTEPTRNPYDSSELTCEVGKTNRKYKTQWYRYRNDMPTDPYFGFDLLLQTNIKGNILWLYNIDHLNYLMEYVESKLREDGGRHKYSMITNLPQWVKSAENRDWIVKKLNRVKQEFKKQTAHN